MTLAQRLSVPVQVPAFEVYRALRLTAPSPYGHFLRLGDFCLAGSAPGSLVRRAEDVIEAHVLAGTRPRGRTAEEERRLEEELRAGERERAAHALRVDLARSDVGCVAEPGTVDTSEWMEVERHSQAMHLASTVRGRPRPDAGPLDLRAGLLPRRRPTAARPGPGPWNSSRSWSRRRAGSTPGRWDTSIFAAAWSCAAPRARWSSPTGAPTGARGP